MMRERLALESRLILGALVAITWVMWPGHFEPFIFSKFLLLALTGAIALGFLIPQFPLLRKMPAFAFFNFFFLAWFIVLVFRSEVIHTSIFGVQGRNMGFLSYLSLAVISIYLASISSEPIVKKTVFMFTIATTGLGLYGVLQILKLDPFNWKLVYQGIIGNLGNPNFMSVMGALFGTSMAFWFLQTKQGNGIKLLSLAGFIVAVANIFFSRSTQGWIVLLIALTPLIFLKFQELSKFISRLFLAVVAAGSTLLAMAIFQTGPLSGLIYQQSLSYRADFWRIAWKMASGNPLFGVGIDRYQNFYREYKTLEQVRLVGAEDFSDSAHNLYLHFAATGGFLFAGLLLALNVFVAYRFVIAMQISDTSKNLVALIFGVWLGIQAQSLISVDYPSIALWGWVFAGLGVGLSYKGIERQTKQAQELGLKYVGHFVSIVASVAAFAILIPASNAQSELKTGFYAYVAKGDSAAIRIKSDFLKNIEAKDSRNPTLPVLSANSLFQDEAFEASLEAAQRAIAIDSHDYRSWWFLASSLEKLGKRVEAIEAREMTVRLSPFNVANLLELGKNQLINGDLSGARKSLQQIAKVDEKSAEFQELMNLIRQSS